MCEAEYEFKLGSMLKRICIYFLGVTWLALSCVFIVSCSSDSAEEYGSKAHAPQKESPQQDKAAPQEDTTPQEDPAQQEEPAQAVAEQQAASQSTGPHHHQAPAQSSTEPSPESTEAKSENDTQDALAQADATFQRKGVAFQLAQLNAEWESFKTQPQKLDALVNSDALVRQVLKASHSSRYTVELTSTSMPEVYWVHMPLRQATGLLAGIGAVEAARRARQVAPAVASAKSLGSALRVANILRKVPLGPLGAAHKWAALMGSAVASAVSAFEGAQILEGWDKEVHYRAHKQGALGWRGSCHLHMRPQLFHTPVDARYTQITRRADATPYRVVLVYELDGCTHDHIFYPNTAGWVRTGEHTGWWDTVKGTDRVVLRGAIVLQATKPSPVIKASIQTTSPRPELINILQKGGLNSLGGSAARKVFELPIKL